MGDVVEGTGKLYASHRPSFSYKRGLSGLSNHERQTAFAASSRRRVATNKVNTDMAPVMGAEIFRSCSTSDPVLSSSSAR